MSENEIVIKWCTADVQERRPTLTVEQAREVLKIIKKKHDANVGVNWDVIDMWADNLFPRKTYIFDVPTHGHDFISVNAHSEEQARQILCDGNNWTDKHKVDSWTDGEQYWEQATIDEIV